ncbi:SubName: Full=Uncharacterized protein {ECO:0000313/EMBL:CCA67269.1} [Serendipita indica DSM 11827]|uniref:Uncharacterized protein n=1 Tax=Serendipita indica (strain DSM 11827) TaxID=1109443 RepID=G4T7E6_SERID|nr:SubName: Full=Uncharacterized protein {ECO:0000313/EMBL:CCA67269.1} [Serendipita indica DSM 11827]CCA67269.1 hypothetical protein PIIN_01102 [Serendipita indica DSM 11827]
MSSANNRASLLSGLRTGGVRTSPIPQTAAIGGSFQPPRFASGLHHQTVYEDALDNQNPYQYGVPMTAAIDGRAPRFQQQQHQAHQQQQQQQQLLLQQAQLAAMGGMPGMQLNPMDPMQSQLLQLQLMQAMVAQQQQAQKLQAEIALQQQVAMAINQRQASVRNTSRIPSTAGPTQTSFDLGLSPPTQYAHERSPIIEENEYSSMPMTAALGGKFGSRSLSSGLNPNAPTFKLPNETPELAPPVPATPSTTVVISGGVTLGGVTSGSTPVASKSDAATSWRRPSNAAGTQPRSVSPPKSLGRQSPASIEIASPEQVARYSPPTRDGAVPKYRPQALRIKDLEVAMSNIEIDQGYPRTIVKPPSPTGSNSSGDSYRKPVVTVRPSVPLRQPRGPPAGAEELTVKNFATRGKRTASAPLVIGQMSTLVEAF